MSVEFQNNYSVLDKVLHKFAFKSQKLQLMFSELEDDLFSKSLKDANTRSPVFITSLPRAGTTLLLELCYNQNEFASHTYRDMPFLLMPRLWAQFSGLFSSSDNKQQERAHGDGMQVSLDSPEAFEEVLWKQFFPAQYTDKSIECFGTEVNKRFNVFFRSHIAKIISLRNQSGENRRYISKNNLNISRLDYLCKLFPDGKVIIPVRDPLQHGASMLAQHRNFTELHKSDDFGRRYMQDVGHYDFGLNLKPVNFNNWLDNPDSEPMQLEFWLDYWFAAFDAMAEQALPNVRFFCYETFKRSPKEGLEAIADFIEVGDRDAFIAQAERINQGRNIAIEPEPQLAGKIERLNTLYAKLVSRAINT